MNLFLKILIQRKLGTQVIKKKKLLAILFIFHSFTVLVKTMVIINKYKMKVNRKIAPSLP